MSKIFKLHIRLCKYSLIIEYLGKTYVIQNLIKGSDSSTPFRCQPKGHLAQSLQHSLRESYSFFIWGRLTTRAHTRPHKKKASQLTLKGFVEGKGFEPSVSLRPTHAFQACSLNHSDTPL